MRTLVDLLVARAASHPDRGFRFLDDDTALTYRELDRDARRIASVLVDRGVARAVLAVPAGLDFIRAFWGCIYAGVVAVPVPAPHPARLARTLPRLQAIVADCAPSVVLTNLDDIDGDPTWQPRALSPDDIAVLQYTSGSTRSPRGVVLDHANILHNLSLLCAFHLEQEHMVMAHWLPLYHDMGLIRGMLSPVHMGADCVIMSPERFVEKPARWLAAVTAHRATTIGAPNFGFELCTRKVTDAELATFDLSSLRIVFASAEPIRKATVDRFLTRFELDPSVFRPAYGLAEATVAVAGARGYRTHAVSALALREGRIAPAVDNDRFDLVSCGPPLGDLDVAIVDEGERAEPDRTGEIWVRGDSVARGYWGQHDTTTFGSYLDGVGPFLRTGDLGWRAPDGELAIVGRIKDVILIRGQTFYPQDLEAAAESIPHVRPGCSAAFAIDTPDGEAAVIVLEVDGIVDWPALVAAIRAAISEQLGLALASIVALDRGTLPKTASGKVQRASTRAQYERGELAAVHTWTHPPRT